MSVLASLDALVVAHDNIGSPLRDQLVPGPPRSTIESAIRDIGLEPPDELVDFFAWRSIGDDEAGAARVGWFWPAAPYRLDEAVREYRRFIEIGGITPTALGELVRNGLPAGATFTGFWRTDWFPIMDGAPEEYAVECGSEGDRSRGAVWRVCWHPDPGFETMRVADSIAAFIDRAVDLFRAGAYRWDPGHRAIMTVDQVFERRGLEATFRP